MREQWRRASDHVRREAASASPAPLRAEPLKLTASPTAHVVADDGALIVTVGGAPAVIVCVVLAVAPAAVVTRRRTATVPGER